MTFTIQTLSTDRNLLSDDTLLGVAEDRGLIDYELEFSGGRWGVQRYRASFEAEMSFGSPAQGSGFYPTAIGSMVELDAQGCATGRALAGFREIEYSPDSPDASASELWDSASPHVRE